MILILTIIDVTFTVPTFSITNIIDLGKSAIKRIEKNSTINM